MRKRCRHLLKVKSSKPSVNNVSHANAAVVTAMVVIADLKAKTSKACQLVPLRMLRLKLLRL